MQKKQKGEQGRCRKMKRYRNVRIKKKVERGREEVGKKVLHSLSDFSCYQSDTIMLWTCKIAMAH